MFSVYNYRLNSWLQNILYSVNIQIINIYTNEMGYKAVGEINSFDMLSDEDANIVALYRSMPEERKKFIFLLVTAEKPPSLPASICDNTLAK